MIIVDEVTFVNVNDLSESFLFLDARCNMMQSHTL